MAEIIPSDIVDFEGLEDTVDRSLLRKASSYLDDLKTEFKPRARPRAEMFSTKLRGGIDFRPGELTCWAGYNGHRKSMFAGQVVLDLIAQKQRVMLSSFEMQPAQSLSRMARQGWGKQTPNDDELSTFASWTDGKLWIFDHIGSITPSKVLAMCRYFQAHKIGHHVFIDSLMMVCSTEDSFDEQKRFITDLVRMAQETGLHVHLIAHCRKPQGAGEERPPSKYDLKGTSAISDQAHNVITVWANKAKKAKQEQGIEDNTEPDVLVTVEKQRNGRWEGRCKLWFDELSMRFCDDGHSRVESYAGLTS